MHAKKNLAGDSIPDITLVATAALALLAGLTVVLRMFLARQGFSEDEFFQLAFVNEKLPHFFVQFFRLDQHPPFHFLQLKLWSIFSAADGWMLLNSVLWHLISCATLYVVARRWLGKSAALLAVALYALIPQVVFSATSLRFYAMIPTLALLAWWLNAQLLSTGERRIWPWLAAVFVQLALGYSHAIGFFFVLWLMVAAAAQQFPASGRVSGRSMAWRRWLAVQAGVIILLLPAMVLAVGRVLMSQGAAGVSDGNADPGGIISHHGGMVAGWGMQWAYAKALGAVFFGAALCLGLRYQATRSMSAVILIGPYAMAALIALVMAPMYKTPVYSAVLVPFTCMALAGGLIALKNHWGSKIAVPLLLAMAVFIFPASSHLNRAVSPYQPVAAELKRLTKPGDLVVIPKLYIYWAIMRYTVGPDWGSPLEVLPALSDSWQRMNNRLGPTLTKALKLEPVTDRIVHDGIVYIVGDNASTTASTVQRVWLVQRPRYPLPIKISPDFTLKGVVFESGDPEVTQILLYQRSTP